MFLNIVLSLISAFGLLAVVQRFTHPRMSLEEATVSLEQICKEAEDPIRNFNDCMNFELNAWTITNQLLLAAEIVGALSVIFLFLRLRKKISSK